jgi:hypothetical protein
MTKQRRGLGKRAYWPAYSTSYRRAWENQNYRSNSLLRIKTIRTLTVCLNDEREAPCVCSSFQASSAEVIQPMLVYYILTRETKPSQRISTKLATT